MSGSCVDFLFGFFAGAIVFKIGFWVGNYFGKKSVE